MPATGLLRFRNVSTIVQTAEFSNSAPTPAMATNYKLQPHSCADARCPGRLGQREKSTFLSILLKNVMSGECFHGCESCFIVWGWCGDWSWPGCDTGCVFVGLGIEDGFTQPNKQPAGISLLNTDELVLQLRIRRNSETF